MQKTNKLFGKAIIAQTTGQQSGTVQDVILDSEARHIVALLVDGGGWFRDAKIVRWSAVVSVGDVVIVEAPEVIVAVKNDPEVAGLMEHPHRLTGTTMISESGERIGQVSDLFINDQGEVVGYEVKQGFISNLSGRKFLPIDAVQAVGSDAVIASGAPLTTVQAEEQAQTESSDAPVEPLSNAGSSTSPQPSRK